MEIHAHVPKVGKDAAHWLLEGVLIVVSVLLAFAVGEYREGRTNRERVARVLNAVHGEMEHNLAVLDPYVPMHEEWLATLEKPDALKTGETGLDVWFATRPALPAGSKSPFPFLTRSAWDAALAGNVLPLVDYDLSAKLADVYRAQDLATGNVQRLAAGALSSTPTYDRASREASVRLLWLTLADIASAEAMLRDLYREHLAAVREAAAAAE